jgi:hypothetical protein
LWDGVIDALHHVPTTTIVFWLEEAFPVAYLKKIPDHVMIEGEKEKEIAAINPFNIANLIGTGDGAALWVMYQQLLQDGHEPEALFGIIWWKLKDIAKKKQSISPAFKKTLHTFMNTYSKARFSGGDLESGLEKLLLETTKEQL